MKKRRCADSTREKIAHRRELRNLRHGPYRNNPYATPSILGEHRIEFLNLNVFTSLGRRELYKSLRQLCEVPKQAKVLLDFSNIYDVKVSATLVLFAHLEVMLRSGRTGRILWSKPKNEELNMILTQQGIWGLLGEPDYSSANSICICSISHKEKETNQKQPLRDAITYAKNAIAAFSDGVEIDDGDATYAAISESFTNVWQHAYSDGASRNHLTLCSSSEVKKWWIALQLIEKQLFIAVYDIGIGIPASTRQKKWYTDLTGELVALFSGKNADCRDIQTALAYGVSRFKEQGRGNGLPAIKRFVEINPDGELCLMSAKGIYTYRSRNDEEDWKSIDNAFPGTLIQWNIALAPQAGTKE